MSFLGQEDIWNNNVDDYIIENLNYLEFKSACLQETEIKMNGVGAFTVFNKPLRLYELFYILPIGKKLFAISGWSKERPTMKSTSNLKGFYLLDANIINNLNFFNGKIEDGVNFYYKMEVDIGVDFKFYEHDDKVRLFVSKSGEANIDLYFSIIIQNDLPQELTVKMNQSIIRDSKYFKMTQKLNQRLKK